MCTLTILHWRALSRQICLEKNTKTCDNTLVSEHMDYKKRVSAKFLLIWHRAFGKKILFSTIEVIWPSERTANRTWNTNLIVLTEWKMTGICLTNTNVRSVYFPKIIFSIAAHVGCRSTCGRKSSWMLCLTYRNNHFYYKTHSGTS